jgi:hypothetical protein
VKEIIAIIIKRVLVKHNKPIRASDYLRLSEWLRLPIHCNKGKLGLHEVLFTVSASLGLLFRKITKLFEGFD